MMLGCVEWDDHVGMERGERAVVGNKRQLS